MNVQSVQTYINEKSIIFPRKKKLTMEEKTESSGEIEESVPLAASVKTKAPEVEVRLYRQGKGPIAVFKSKLGGWDQDQLEIGDILHKYGFKSVYAFNPDSGRGFAIRIHPRNGRSFLSYQDGSVIFMDGEPKVCLRNFCRKNACNISNYQMETHQNVMLSVFLFFLRLFGHFHLCSSYRVMEYNIQNLRKKDRLAFSQKSNRCSVPNGGV